MEREVEERYAGPFQEPNLNLDPVCKVGVLLQRISFILETILDRQIKYFNECNACQMFEDQWTAMMEIAKLTPGPEFEFKEYYIPNCEHEIETGRINFILNLLKYIQSQ